MAVFTALLSLFLFVLYVVYRISKRKFDYWEKQKVPHVKPMPIFGNYKDYILLKRYIGHVNQELCQKFPNEPYVGSYYGTEPALIVKSPELLKLITTKDFYYFSSREVAKYTHKEVFTQNLFFTFGDRWRVVRQNMTPLFSSAKMKNMFYLVDNCTRVFEKLLDDLVQKSNVHNMRDLFARFTMDCIGFCIFGVETKVMGNDKNNDFRRMGDLIFEISNRRGLGLIGRAIWPAIFYGMGQKTFSTDVDGFFQNLMVNVFKSRKYEPSARNDFVDMLLNLKKNEYFVGDSITNLKTGEDKKIHIKADDDLLVAQCLTLFAAGYETSSTTAAFAFYELAKNPETQIKAIAEIDAYLKAHNNKLGYECVKELPYVQACIDETLRFYPVLGVINREVVEDYVLPTGVRLEKGTRVHLPVYHLQRDPDHFPEPELFQPERFLPENKHNIKPFTYMPFGEGPRICIGLRFAKMNITAGMISVLKKYRVKLADDMTRNVAFDPRGIVTTPVGGINLKFVKREGWEGRVFKV